MIWSLLELFSSVLAVIEVLKTQIWAQLRSNRAVFISTETWILYCLPICTIYYCSVGIYQPFKNGHEIVLALHLVQVLRVMKTRLSSGDEDLAFWIPMFPGRGAVNEQGRGHSEHRIPSGLPPSSTSQMLAPASEQCHWAISPANWCEVTGCHLTLYTELGDWVHRSQAGLSGCWGEGL